MTEAMQNPKVRHKATIDTSFLTIQSKPLVPPVLLVALTGADQLRHCFT